MWIINAPKIYQVYLGFSLGNSLFRWLLPGLQAQLITGTWLGILKMVWPQMYKENVAQRLKQMLTKQAALRSGKVGPLAAAQSAPPAAVLEVAAQRLREDAVLLDALGSTSALRIWHRLEKNRIDDPEVMKGLAPTSQSAWIVESLRAGYMEDLEKASLEAKFATASKDASEKMKALSQAVDVAGSTVQHGVFGGRGDAALKSVAQASTKATESMKALDELKRQMGAEEKEQLRASRTRWFDELSRLKETNAISPEVAEELSRLECLATESNRES